MSDESAEVLSEVVTRLREYEDEWAWHEQTDDQLAGYGWHMGQMLYRLPRDSQTRDMQASIESMLSDLRILTARLAVERAAHAEEVAGLRAKVAAVEALFAGGPDTPCCTTWRREDGLWGEGGRTECVEVPMDDLRAALATPPTVQREAEVGARVLREAADAWPWHDMGETWLRARADALTDAAGSGA